MKSMHIGRLAAQANVSVDTVRYYERAQLLPSPVRSHSGYRVYPVEAVGRLRFIRRAKELGFSLDEIRGMLSVSDSRDAGVASVREIAAQRLAMWRPVWPSSRGSATVSRPWSRPVPVTVSQNNVPS